MRTRLVTLFLVFLLFPSTLFQPAQADRRPGNPVPEIPAPQDVLGFVPGDDRKLASWNQVLNYFDKLDQASDRVIFEALGKSTMDAPFVMATISAPENLARLEYFIDIQRKLADPRKLGPPAQRDRRARALIAQGKTIVLITCGIHSTEVGSYLSSMLIAHRLASSNDPEILDILRNTIVLLVPSLNPDGVDIIKKWYDKTLGTPHEGTSPPELYHKYTGHDNNRDWYAFTQVETKITVDKIHNRWHPQIVHDIHQQDQDGSRLFLPPYKPPVEPNVPREVVEGYTELGNWMAKELRAQGLQGITTNSTYDAWSPSRAYSHYHGGVRILSETASARIASPITMKFEQLKKGEQGYDPQKESANFGPVWRGGEWRLRDITHYMTSAAFKLLRHASQNRERWLSRFYEVGKEAVRPRRKGELFGYSVQITPAIPRTRKNTQELLDILTRAGVEFEKGFLPGFDVPQEIALVKLAQPYGAFARALLEPRQYPDLRDAAGHPMPPYDVTAHDLGLLMGVSVTPLHTAPREFRKIPVRQPARQPQSVVPSDLRWAIYKSHVASMDEGWTRWVLERQFSRLPQYASVVDKDVRAGNLHSKYDTIIIPDQSPGSILNGHRAGAMPAEYTGGLGSEGIKGLRDFVEQGGTLVCLNRASEFAIEQFKLPVRNVVDGLSEREFFVPGSILRIDLDTSHPIARHMPRQTVAWVEDSPVFEIKSNPLELTRVRIVARYPADGNPLLSGWLLGANRLRGKAALVEVPIGKGRIVLFGFRPQYRAQSLATYPLLFNAMQAR